MSDTEEEFCAMCAIAARLAEVDVAVCDGLLSLRYSEAATAEEHLQRAIQMVRDLRAEISKIDRGEETP